MKRDFNNALARYDVLPQPICLPSRQILSTININILYTDRIVVTYIQYSFHRHNILDTDIEVFTQIQ